MRFRISQVLILVLTLLLASQAFAQNRPTDELSKEDRLGVTTMFNWRYKNWQSTDERRGGEFNFDHFRVWAQTDMEDKWSAAVQYRFYEGWRTPHHLYIAYHSTHGTLQVGQTWVPFGIDWQPFDDWGNIVYYVGLQDDYDYGITWNHTYDKVTIHLGFFKNQQLSSGSRERYDTDIFSGDVGDDDIISKQKANEETNQVNIRAEYEFDIGEGSLEVGGSALYGQLYNIDTDRFGDRTAFEAHACLSQEKFRANIQGTFYDYNQKLPADADPHDKDFINVASWNFAYEIPSKANILSASGAVDLVGEKLTAHLNYSMLTGGTSESKSHLLTGGLSSFWNALDFFLEAYYGINDPQLSGDASGYGRDVDSRDVGVQLRIYYRLSMLKKSTVPKPGSGG